MKKAIAIIDCGTNTFTLNLFEVQSSGKFERTQKKRFFVELASESILQICPEAFQRGINAFKSFSDYLQKYPDVKIMALGTAALRRASNSLFFVNTIENKFGIKIQIIDGNREALLIYKGVRLAAPLTEEPSLIIDVGGGSVEIIIANYKELLWAHSFPLGNAVLYEKFHKSDPISGMEIKQIEEYLVSQLQILIHHLKKYSINYVIGAAGSFDVFEQLCTNKSGKIPNNQLFSIIATKKFKQMYQELISSTFEERNMIKNINDSRAKLIVMSVILVNFILKQTKPKDIIASNRAMSEGLASEILLSAF